MVLIKVGVPPTSAANNRVGAYSRTVAPAAKRRTLSVLVPIALSAVSVNYTAISFCLRTETFCGCLLRAGSV
jgi:hypothetical protein